MDNAPKPMKMSDFERKVQVYKPILLTYGKTFNGKKFEIRELFIHFENRKCVMKLGTNALAEMLQMLKEEFENGKS